MNIIAGSGKHGYSGGVGANASFYNPRGITIDQQTGTLFVSDFSNHAIRKISSEGRFHLSNCITLYVLIINNR